MPLKIDELKQRMKDEYAKKVEQYFSQYEELKENGKFDINGIETLLGRGIDEAKDVLIATSEELIKTELGLKSSQDSKKKHVLSAGRRSDFGTNREK